MPRKGDYGDVGDADRPVQGVYLSKHALDRAIERGVPVDDLRRRTTPTASMPDPTTTTKARSSSSSASKTVVGGVAAVVAPGGLIVTTFRAGQSGGRGSTRAHPAPGLERRVDPADGKSYTEAEFRAYYPRPGQAAEKWAGAGVVEVWSAGLPGKLAGIFIGKGGAAIRVSNNMIHQHAAVSLTGSRRRRAAACRTARRCSLIVARAFWAGTVDRLVTRPSTTSTMSLPRSPRLCYRLTLGPAQRQRPRGRIHCS